METIGTTHGEHQTVVFRLASESYGIEISRVNEIIRIREITPIPRTEGYIRGLVNLRGKTIPVVDLKARLGLGESIDTESSRIIVVEGAQGNVGVVVDAVTEVVILSDHQIEDTPPLVSSFSTDYVRGIAKEEGHLITLLDLDKALAAH